MKVTLMDCGVMYLSLDPTDKKLTVKYSHRLKPISSAPLAVAPSSPGQLGICVKASRGSTGIRESSPQMQHLRREGGCGG